MSSSRVLPFFCILFFSIPVFGQGFVAEGSNWIIRSAYKTDVPGTSYSYFTRNISGEKQYNSRTYKNFLAMSATFTDTMGYLREENEKVYFKYEPLPWRQGIDTSEFLLYDFGLAMGDTVHLRFDLHSQSFICYGFSSNY